LTLKQAPRRNRAATYPGHGDVELRGRTYAIPFDRVWNAAVKLCSGGLSRWVLLGADDGPGRLDAEAGGRLGGRGTEFRIRITLDENAQTRVDTVAATPGNRWDFGAARRRTLRFFRALDRELDADESRILLPPRHSLVGLALMALLLAGCGESRGDAGSQPAAAPPAADSSAPVARRIYERSVVFLSTESDSAFIVPWIVEASTRAGGVDRRARAWLGRNGQWDRFLGESWSTGPSREPWLVLPRGSMRILVGENDRLDRIFYRDGNRSVEVSLGDALAEWTGNRGAAFNVLEGEMVLGDRQISGQVLDVSQGLRVEEGAMGDWLVLSSDEALTLVLHAPLHGEDGSGEYQGWSREGSRSSAWARVDVEWAESRSFEPARRDIPSLIRFASRDGALEGELTVLDLELETRPGGGPILPVDGIMEVEGVVALGDREFAVRGILRHRQP
jgi:hypothetical protein